MNLHEDRQIGKQKVVCVRQYEDYEGKENGKEQKATLEWLLSNDVPGRLVELKGAGEFGGVKFKREVCIEAFEAVKEK